MTQGGRDSVSITIDTANLIEAFAAMKGIPVKDVIKHAAKDFAKAARHATPKAPFVKSDYSRLLWSGKFHYVKYSRFMMQQPKKQYHHYIRTSGGKLKAVPTRRGWAYKKRLMDKHRVKVLRGWSQASRIGIYQMLGMTAGLSQGRLPGQVRDISRVKIPFFGQHRGEITLIDEIHFESTQQDGAERKIIQAGFQAAAKPIVREFNRMVKQALKGKDWT